MTGEKNVKCVRVTNNSETGKHSQLSQTLHWFGKEYISERVPRGSFLPRPFWLQQVESVAVGDLELVAGLQVGGMHSTPAHTDWSQGEQAQPTRRNESSFIIERNE